MTCLRFEPVNFGSGARQAAHVDIATADVHVYGFLLKVDDGSVSVMKGTLGNEELERANRLVSERHRREFVVAHGMVREVLSRYCGRPPHELKFEKTASGKPFLVDDARIRFNLTHSHGRSVIVVGREREVGVDLEMLRPEVDVISLARRFFSSRDQAFIEGSGQTGWHERFLQTWVVREAVFKALGTGMTFPLDQDHVEFSNNGTEARLITATNRGVGAEMSVRFLSLESGWIGAVAAEGMDWTVGYRRFFES